MNLEVRKMKLNVIVCLAAACSGLLTAASNGAFIVDPTSAAATANYGGAVIGRTTDYSGLSGLPATLATGAPVPSVYPTDASTGHTGADYLSNNTQTVTVTYDLGQAYLLGDGTNSFHLYNYNEGTDTGNTLGYLRMLRT